MTATPPADGAAPDRRLVVVMGPGRSGTSSVSGALARSGFGVPGEQVPADATNPAGFFEPQWVVDFHTDLLAKARVWTLDTSPDAPDLVAKAVRGGDVRGALRDWLAGRFDEQPRLVVKDPRILWFGDLWREVAAELGAGTGFVTMLRHPAEVAGSRQEYYAREDRTDTRALGIHRIAGWVNGLLSAELMSRPHPRAFVAYDDLLADWRPQLARVAERLDLRLDPAPDQRPHPVDGFIDPSLHRVQADWAGVDVPDALRDLADRVWAAATRLPATDDDATRGELDGLRAEYHRMREDAVILSRPAITRAEAAGRRRGRRQLKAELAEREQAAAPSEPAPAPAEEEPAGLVAGLRRARAKLSGGES